MELQSKAGYSIVCDAFFQEKASLTVIALHGIAGDRKSSCIARLRDRLSPCHVNLICFDWPAHGDSNADDAMLRVENCLEDLKTVFDYVKSRAPRTKVLAFATSFGAYITLLFRLRFPDAFQGVILRSPAIRFYDDMMENILSPEQLETLSKEGACHFGFERIMRISGAFLQDAREQDILRLYAGRTCEHLDIIHGNRDTAAPMQDSASFCRLTGARLHEIDGADHRYSGSGQLEAVIDTAEAIVLQQYLQP